MTTPDDLDVTGLRARVVNAKGTAHWTVAVLLDDLLDALATERERREAAEESLGGMVEWQAEVICDTREALVAERLRYVGDLRGSRPPGKVPIDMGAVLAILDRERNANPSRYDTEKARREAAEGEVARLRGQVERRQSKLGELDAEVARMTAERDLYKGMYEDLSTSGQVWGQ